MDAKLVCQTVGVALTMDACVSVTVEQTNKKNSSMCVSLVLVPTNTP
jgi:hypothetical protein